MPITIFLIIANFCKVCKELEGAEITFIFVKKRYMGPNNKIKKNDTFFQWRKDIMRSAPILLRVIDLIEDVHEGLTSYKVKWHILEEDKVYPSVLPMVAIDNEFYEFKPIPRKCIGKRWRC